MERRAKREKKQKQKDSKKPNKKRDPFVQLPDESYKEFCKRVNLGVREMLKEKSQRTAHQKERQRKIRAEKKKAKDDAKTDQQNDDEDMDKLYGKEKIAFGDIVERPLLSVKNTKNRNVFGSMEQLAKRAAAAVRGMAMPKLPAAQAEMLNMKDFNFGRSD